MHRISRRRGMPRPNEKPRCHSLKHCTDMSGTQYPHLHLACNKSAANKQGSNTLHLTSGLYQDVALSATPVKSCNPCKLAKIKLRSHSW